MKGPDNIKFPQALELELHNRYDELKHEEDRLANQIKNLLEEVRRVERIEADIIEERSKIEQLMNLYNKKGE